MQVVFRFRYTLLFAFSVLLFLFITTTAQAGMCFGPLLTTEYRAYLDRGWNFVFVSLALILFLINLFSLKQFIPDKKSANKFFSRAFGIAFLNLLFFCFVYFISISLSSLYPAELGLNNSGPFSLKDSTTIRNFLYSLFGVYVLIAHLFFLFSFKILGNLSRQKMVLIYAVNCPLWGVFITQLLGFLYQYLVPFNGQMYRAC